MEMNKPKELTKENLFEVRERLNEHFNLARCHYEFGVEAYDSLLYEIAEQLHKGKSPVGQIDSGKLFSLFGIEVRKSLVLHPLWGAICDPKGRAVEWFILMKCEHGISRFWCPKCTPAHLPIGKV